MIIEKESLDEDENRFARGKAIKVLKDNALFKAFDADGVWENELREIPFSKITAITYGSRYVEVFSKYLSPIT